jgi:hypothetical protein
MPYGQDLFLKKQVSKIMFVTSINMCRMLKNIVLTVVRIKLQYVPI